MIVTVQPYKFTLLLFILHLIFYSFFMYSEDERIEWIIVVMCEKNQQLKKSRKIDILMEYNVK